MPVPQEVGFCSTRDQSVGTVRSPCRCVDVWSTYGLLVSPSSSAQGRIDPAGVGGVVLTLGPCFSSGCRHWSTAGCCVCPSAVNQC